MLQNGALIDTRPPEEKAKDFQVKEIVAAAAPVNWIEKPQSQWRKFPIFNQNGSGSCVAQTEAKELGILRYLKDQVYVHFSATDIYQRRVNKPGAGMGAIDARSIAAKGVTLEVLTPSQNLSDSQMDNVVVEPYKRSVGEVFSVPNYLELVAGNIDSIASMIQATNKGAMVWFYFTYDEWKEKPVIVNPALSLYDEKALKHSVTAVDFALVNGVKSLIIEDSWGDQAGYNGQRVITEDFFKKRNWYASYLMSFKFDTPSTKPIHTFNLDLEFGMTSAEVVALQDCLKYEGLFPSNGSSTGYFGAITKKAVQGFQTKYNVTSSSDPYYGRVGPKTRIKLNQLFST